MYSAVMWLDNESVNSEHSRGEQGGVQSISLLSVTHIQTSYQPTKPNQTPPHHSTAVTGLQSSPSLSVSATHADTWQYLGGAKLQPLSRSHRPFAGLCKVCESRNSNKTDMKRSCPVNPFVCCLFPDKVLLDQFVGLQEYEIVASDSGGTGDTLQPTDKIGLTWHGEPFLSVRRPPARPTRLMIRELQLSQPPTIIRFKFCCEVQFIIFYATWLILFQIIIQFLCFFPLKKFLCFLNLSIFPIRNSIYWFYRLQQTLWRCLFLFVKKVHLLW